MAGQEDQPLGQLAARIQGEASTTGDLYHRLVLVVGPPRSGKTTALRELASANPWPLLNLNMALSERLLELTSRQRALKAPRLLDQLLKEQDSDVVLLDNAEILFSRELQQDPLRLLKGISRNRTVVASWPGEHVGDHLTYSEPSHGEFQRYHHPDVVIVTTVDAQSSSTQAESWEQA